MKIAILGHKHCPSREGGIEVVVSELAPRLAVNNDVTVFDRYEIGSKRHLSDWGKVHIRKAPTLKKSGANAMIASLTGTIKAIAGKFDVIHYHAEGPCAMIWLPHLFKRKTVVTIHGLDWQRSKWGGFAARYIKFGEKMAAKYADEIIVLSQDVADYFKMTYNRDTVLIKNGVSAAVFADPDHIKDFDLKGNDYILYLGRLVPEKGVHYLIEAYKASGLKEKLIIAGEITNTEYVQSLIQEESDNIIFAGFADREFSQELFTNARAYVLPSEIEGMSMSLLEAMSYGKAILASNIPENTDILGPYGITFESANVESLTENLQKVVTLPSYNKEEIDYVMKSYDWDIVTKKTLEVYKKAVQKGN